MIRYWFRLLIWKVRWLKWFFGYPGYRFGDPLLGSGDVREKNRNIISDRYNRLEPQRPKR